MSISRTVDCAVKDKPSELFGCFDPGKNKQHNQYDLLDDIGIFPTSYNHLTNDQEELVVKLMSDDDYRRLVRTLNETQRQFFFIMSYFQLKQKMTV